jgi:hypothetical protein
VNVRVGHDQDEVARRAADGLDDLLGPPLTQELEHWRRNGARGIHGQVHQAPGAGTLGTVGQLADLRAGRLGKARCRQTDHPATRLEHRVEHAEAAAADDVAEVAKLHPETHVGLVRAEPVDRLAVRKARER